MKDSQKPAKYHVDQRGSDALGVIEQSVQMLRDTGLRIPPVVITFVDVHSRRLRRGYFALSIWKKRRGTAHEIGISPKLIADPKQLVATLLHEIAHAILHEAGENGGMGSTSYYHTTTFRDQCVSLGLQCCFAHNRYGWTITDWPHTGVPDRYRKVIEFLNAKLPAGTGSIVSYERKGKALPRSGHILLRCQCDDESRSVYVNKSTMKTGGIVCDFCKHLFRTIR